MSRTAADSADHATVGPNLREGIEKSLHKLPAACLANAQIEQIQSSSFFRIGRLTQDVPISLKELFGSSVPGGK